MSELVKIDNQPIEKQKEYNDRLFNMFHQLIEPIRDIENSIGQRNYASNKIVEIKNSKVPTMTNILLFCFGLFLYFKLWDIGRPLIGKFYGGPIEALSFFLCIGGTYGIFYYVRKKRNEKKIVEYQNSYEKHNNDVIQKTSKIQNGLQFVPQKYRSSDALSKFVEYYVNGRANSMGEAINIYETHLHQMRMERNQQQILQQNEIMLQNQSNMAAELDFVTAMTILNTFN